MNIQNKFKKTNTIYKITKDMDLEGSTLIIPVGCTLDFQGGSFKNGTINFNDTILSGDIKIKTRLTGSVKNNEISVLWFNVVGDGITDDRLAIQDVFDITPANSTVIFPRVSGFYKVIIGTGKGSTIIAQRADALANDTLYPIKVSKDSVTVIVRGIIKSTTILGNMFELQGNSIVFIGEGGKLQGPGGEDTIGFLDTNTSDTTLQWHPSLLKVNGDNCNVSSLSFEDYPTHGIDCYGKALIVDSCLFIGGRVAHSTTGGTVLMGIRTNVGADSVIIKNNRFIANSKGGKCYSCVFPSGDNFIISNNICEKYHEHAVYAYGNYGSIIDNKFTDVNCIASDIQYFATYGSIKGNYSIGTEGFVQIMHGKGTIIEGNTVTNCRGGIIVRPYHTVDVDKLPSGLKLLNNYIELTAGTTGSCLSFYVLGTYDISDILISGNTFANGYYTQTSQIAASLLIGAGSSENNGIKFLRVENNVIRSGRGAVSWLKGIHNSIFKNNKFISETIDGVTSAFSSAINANYVTDTIFEGNEFIDLKETPTMARIIQLNTGTSNLTVSDNNIINYTSNIYLDYDTDAKIIYKNNNRRNYLSLAGSYDNKPNAYAQEYGVNYYDKDHQIPIWWSGVRWKDSLGSYIVLSKSDINTPNKLYRILFDIDLNGETLTLPANCTLDFQGGSFSNGTVVFNNTTITADSSNYIFKDIIFKGSLKNSDFYVDWVGASASNEDNSDFIKQAVIVSSTFRVPIVFNSVIYNITKPIILDTLINNVTIKGNKARIQKVNSVTTGITESVPTYGGNVNINYACIFCITEGHYWTIRDLAFYGGTPEAYNNYGMFIIKGSNFLIENVGFTYCSIAMYVFGLWMSNFTKVTCTDVYIGFNFNSNRLNDIIGNSGTSICFNNCYVNRCNTGFNLKWLNYSVLNSCAVDYATTNAYTYADKSCVTMNGCGSETSKSWINLLSNSNIVLNACQFLSTTAENTSTIVLFNSKILFNNCTFQDYTTKAIFTNKESNITLIDTDVSVTDTTLTFNASGVYYIKLKNKVYIITYDGERIENIIDYSNLFKGTTAERPTITVNEQGFQYYDITINKPIWWNGTNWIDATGTTV